jgi:hypothetical protein
VTFAGSGGDLLLYGEEAPTAVISGFAPGDEVTFAGLTYESNFKATVKTAGVVTISAGTTTLNVDVAGATVGETGFTLASTPFGTFGTVLGTTTAQAVGPVKMAFLRPISAAAPAALPAAMPEAVMTGARPAAMPKVLSGTHPTGWAEALIPHTGGLAMLAWHGIQDRFLTG